MGGAVATALAEQRTDADARAGDHRHAARPRTRELPFAARLGFVPVIGEAIKRLATDGMVKKGLEDAFAPGFDVPDQFVDDFNRDDLHGLRRLSRRRPRDFGDERPLDAALGRRAASRCW